MDSLSGANSEGRPLSYRELQYSSLFLILSPNTRIRAPVCRSKSRNFSKPSAKTPRPFSSCPMSQVAPADPSVDLELGDAALAEKFATKWKEHHTRHVWTGMADARKVVLQSRFASAVALVGGSASVLLAVLEATGWSGVYLVGYGLNGGLLLLVWSATLPQANPWQVKFMCAIMFLGILSDQIIIAANTGSPYWFTLGLILLLGPLWASVMKKISTAVRYSRTQEELIHIATTTSAKIFGSLPVFFYLLLGLIQQIVASPRLEKNVCKLLVNTTNTTSGAWWNPDGKSEWQVVSAGVWENCDIYSMNVPDPVRTVHDSNLKIALLQLSENESIGMYGYLRCAEFPILFLTTIVLNFVRHKTSKDILAMRASGAELALVVSTGIRLMLDAYIGSISLTRMSIEEIQLVGPVAMLCWWVLFVVAFILIIYLVVISIRAQNRIKRDAQAIINQRRLFHEGTGARGCDDGEEGTGATTPQRISNNNNNDEDKDDVSQWK